MLCHMSIDIDCDIVLSGHAYRIYQFRHLLPLPTIFNLHIPISMAAWEQAKLNFEGLPMYLSPLRRCQLTSPVSGLRMKALAFFLDPLRYWTNSASRRSLPTVSESQITVSCFLARVIATFNLLLSPRNPTIF